MHSVQSICVTFIVFCTQNIAADDNGCVKLGTNNVEFCDLEKLWESRSLVVVHQDKAFVKIVILPATWTLLLNVAGRFIYFVLSDPLHDLVPFLQFKVPLELRVSVFQFFPVFLGFTVVSGLGFPVFPESH